MKKRLLMILMFVCMIFTATACGKKETVKTENNASDKKKVEIVETHNQYEKKKDEEVEEVDPADIITATLYNYYTDSYYKVKINKNDVFDLLRSAVKDGEYYDDLKVEEGTFNENDTYSLIDLNYIEYNVYSGNKRYNDTLDEIQSRIEFDNPDPSFQEPWTDYYNEYIYNDITYTVGYHNDGMLEIYIENPYTNVYDMMVLIPDIGKENKDYLKIAEDCIDSIEFVKP